MISLSIIIALIKDKVKPLFYISVALLWSFGCYNQGVRNVKAEWKAANAAVEAKIAQDITDNKILAATIKGENYVWKNALNIEFDNANRLSTDFDLGFGEASTTSRTINSSEGGRVSSERTRIATERKSIISEIVRIRQTRNYLAREAKFNTKTLIDLQKFSKESK